MIIAINCAKMTVYIIQIIVVSRNYFEGTIYSVNKQSTYIVYNM